MLTSKHSHQLTRHNLRRLIQHNKQHEVMRIESKPLRCEKGKNANNLAREAEFADAPTKVHEAAEHGELDALIEQQEQFCKRVIQKNKCKN